jgi:hypothetical protein
VPVKALRAALTYAETTLGIDVDADYDLAQSQIEQAILYERAA